MSYWSSMSYEVKRREASRFHDDALAHNAPFTTIRLHLALPLRSLVRWFCRQPRPEAD